MKVLFASLVVALLSVASVVESWSARHFKRCVASAVVSTGLLSGSTQIVLADTASELFAKATKAIQNNEGEYKALDEEWKATKKTLADTDKLVGNTGAMLASVAQAGDAFTAKVDKLVADDVVTLTNLQAEVNALRAATGLKYKDAEAAAQNPRSNTAATAQLFAKAQNEAATLAQVWKFVPSQALS